MLGHLLQETFAVDLAQGADSVVAYPEATATDFGARNAVDGSRDTYWYAGDGVLAPELTLLFGSPVRFDLIELREYLALGQRVEGFAIDVWRHGTWVSCVQGTGIGNRRLLRCAEQSTVSVRFRVEEASAGPVISQFGLYSTP
jgi:alpha-L-fucosidase